MNDEHEGETESGPSEAAKREAAEQLALTGARRRELSGLPRRILLTYRNHGPRTLAFRALTFPLRFTPLRGRLRLRTNWLHVERREAERWYREHGRPVEIVIPSFRDAEH
ncbi:MAG: hypothetical protein ACYCU0_15635, partial [Solirubrobacteraceae bacterium]